MSDSFFILTGGPGSGKSSLIAELKNRGISCIDEVARQIIREEVLSGGEALPWKNVELFKEMMLLRSLETYNQALQTNSLTLFDRGLIDIIGYATLTKTPISKELKKAVLSWPYNKKVFIAAHKNLNKSIHAQLTCICRLV